MAWARTSPSVACSTGEPGAGGETGGIDPFGQAQAHQQGFAGACRRVQDFLRGAAVAGGFHPGGPGLRRAVAAGGDQLVAQSHAAMGAGADADVVAVAPVGEVVPAFAAGAGVVGDLVALQPGIRRHVPGEGVECCGVVVLRQGQFAAAVPALEHRAGFDGELVQREMVAAEAQRRFQFPPAQAGRLWPGRA